jgi:predicted MPP superfamily phosphohydrolase
MPPRRQLPEIHFLAEAPPPPGLSSAAPTPEIEGADPESTPPVLPPRTYRPRSLERRFEPEQPKARDARWAPPLTYTPPLPPPSEPPPVTAPPSPAKRAQAALADAVEGAAVAEVVSRPWRKPTSGEWGLAAAVGVLGGLAIALALWATGPGRDEVVVEKYRVPVVELPPALEGLRIAHVSDLLVPGSVEVAARAAALVARERPDVVVLTGDLLDGGGAPALEALAPLLPKLRGRLATFAVSGEHDLAGGVTRAGLAASLGAQGITLLDGTRRNVVVDGATIAFLGATGDSAATAALHATGPRALAVWAMHAPGWLATTASLPLRDEGALLLAGHTRGGQVRLPFTRGVRPDGSGPYVGGFYPVGNGLLHVSRGIGTQGVRARLLSAPSVTVLTLGRGTVAGEAPVALK